MNYFVIGDVHGCFHTYRQLLDQWDPKSEHLIQVGDLIDRGNHNPEVLQLSMEIDANHENTDFLMGNHEVLCLEHFRDGNSEVWLRNGGSETLKQFESQNFDIPAANEWLENRPLKFESPHLLVTHAGLGTRIDPYDIENRIGVLWNRRPPINLGKLQVFGHTPQHSGEPFQPVGLNFINIDTAAVYNQKLSAVRLTEQAEIIEFVQIPTLPGDSNYKTLNFK